MQLPASGQRGAVILQLAPPRLARCFLFHSPSSSSVYIRTKTLLCSVFQQGPLGAPGDAGLPGQPGPKGLQGPKVGTQREIIDSFLQSGCSHVSTSSTFVTSCSQGGKGEPGSAGEKVRKLQGRSDVSLACVSCDFLFRHPHTLRWVSPSCREHQERPDSREPKDRR